MEKIPKVFSDKDIAEFNNCWDEICKKYPNKKTKVKKNFARGVTLKILWVTKEHFPQFNLSLPEPHKMATPTIKEVLDYIFKAHVYHTEELTDSERAEKQKDKDAKYLEKLANDFFLVYCYREQLYKNIELKYSIIFQYINFIVERLKETTADIPHQLGAERFKTMKRMFGNAFELAQEVSEQLLIKKSIGFASILLRSLYEKESFIIVLNQNKQQKVWQTYYDLLDFYNYVAFKHDPDFWETTRENVDDCKEQFNKLKTNLGYKGKQDFKFITYGWIRSIEGHEKDSVNFASLRKLAAGMSAHKHFDDSEFYTFASQFVHQSEVSDTFDASVLYDKLYEKLIDVLDNLFSEICTFFYTYDCWTDDLLKERKRLHANYLLLG